MIATDAVITRWRRGLKPRGRNRCRFGAFDEGSSVWWADWRNPLTADAQNIPALNTIFGKRGAFSAFLGAPIIQRRQLSRRAGRTAARRQCNDESEESFLVTPATQMAAILSQLAGQQRCSGNTGRRGPRASWCGGAAGRAYRNGWQDATMPLMKHQVGLRSVYAGYLLNVVERRTGALEEEAANDLTIQQTLCRRRAKSICFSICTTPAFRRL